MLLPYESEASPVLFWASLAMACSSSILFSFKSSTFSFIVIVFFTMLFALSVSSHPTLISAVISYGPASRLGEYSLEVFCFDIGSEFHGLYFLISLPSDSILAAPVIFVGLPSILTAIILHLKSSFKNSWPSVIISTL